MSEVSRLKFASGEYDLKDKKARDGVDVLKNVVVSIDDFPKLEGEPCDSARFQRAIDNATHIMIPNGEYTFTSTLYYRQGVRLEGQSNEYTILNMSNNLPLFKKLDQSGRLDNFQLSNMKLQRWGSGVNTPLIDMSYTAYSKLEKLNCYQYNNNGANSGCVGVQFGYASHYNTVSDCTFRQFNVGIWLQNEANGNTITGGSCISCVKYGVQITKTNSTQIISHAVELVAEVGYKIENRSIYNHFIACRCESVNRSYELLFEANNQSSIYNMIIGGLDYSVNGKDFGLSNYDLNVTGMRNLYDQANRNPVDVFEGWRLVSNSSQTNVYNTVFTKLLTKSSYLARGGVSVDATNSQVTVKGGMYKIIVNVNCATAQANGIRIGYRINGVQIHDVYATQLSGGTEYCAEFTAHLNAGDVVDIVIKPSTQTNITSGPSTCVTGYQV